MVKRHPRTTDRAPRAITRRLSAVLLLGAVATVVSMPTSAAAAVPRELPNEVVSGPDGRGGPVPGLHGRLHACLEANGWQACTLANGWQ
ncbi:hypothetical protein GCM10009716_17670 [Streptomyces sodiiphilus]|uniref:Secreted protein n=1 Tax=Streptomyces sodiiphilus TaxID=226217 RepID=A0ABN2NZM9_9ACTN